MKFELDKEQQLKLEVWQKKIKDLCGEYGLYDFIFTPYGIGTGLKVFSHLIKRELDLTNVENW
jgi:hypothetical protein